MMFQNFPITYWFKDKMSFFCRENDPQFENFDLNLQVYFPFPKNIHPSSGGTFCYTDDNTLFLIVVTPASGIMKHFLGVFKRHKNAYLISSPQETRLQQSYKLSTHLVFRIWSIFNDQLGVNWHLENWKNLYNCGGSRGRVKHNTSPGA